MHGGAATGRALAEGAIDGVVFTGSAEVGRALGRRFQEGRYARPAITEMGGKNPAIVAASADLDAAAAGHRRLRVRLLGPEVQRLLARDRARRGPRRAGRAARRARGRARRRRPRRPRRVHRPGDRRARGRALPRRGRGGRRDGAVAAGGHALDLPGHFVAPTVVAGLPAGHRLTREELFVPFVTVTRVGSFDEALAEANAIDYGLTAGVFSRDDAELERFLDEIEAGVVYVNRRAGATTGAWPGFQSFCGWKSSGSTGKGGLGPYYVQQFMREQSRTVVRTRN